MPDYVYKPDAETLTGTSPDIKERAVANTIQEKAGRAINDIKMEVGSGVPDPTADPEALYRTVRELKVRYEQLTRTRGDRGKSAVLVEELADLFEVVIRELDKRYSQVPIDPPIITDPDTGDDVTLEDLAALAKALNAHTSNTFIHFGDAPEQEVWVRSLGEWYQGMTYEQIIEYVAEQIETSVPSDGLQQVQDDPNPTLGGNLNLNSYGFTSAFTAGSALSRGDLCYLSSAGTMVHTDASSSDTCRSMLGICTVDVDSGLEAPFVIKGFFGGLSGLTAGDVLYVSTTAGTWQVTRPFGDGDIIRPIGYATAADTLFFDPDKTWTELQSQ
jgi:hypothetical protein